MVFTGPPLARRDANATTHLWRRLTLGIGATYTLLAETSAAGLNAPLTRWFITYFALRVTSGAVRIQEFLTVPPLTTTDLVLDQADAAIAWNINDWSWVPPSDIVAFRPDWVTGIGGSGLRLLEAGGAGSSAFVILTAYRATAT